MGKFCKYFVFVFSYQKFWRQIWSFFLQKMKLISIFFSVNPKPQLASLLLTKAGDGILKTYNLLLLLILGSVGEIVMMTIKFRSPSMTAAPARDVGASTMGISEEVHGGGGTEGFETLCGGSPTRSCCVGTKHPFEGIQNNIHSFFCWRRRLTTTAEDWWWEEEEIFKSFEGAVLFWEAKREK